MLKNFSKCGRQNEAGIATVCLGEQKDDSTRFQATFDGVRDFKLYNEESKQYICKGKAKSFDGNGLVAKDVYEAENCWIEITIIEFQFKEKLEEFQIYFPPTVLSL